MATANTKASSAAGLTGDAHCNQDDDSAVDIGQLQRDVQKRAPRVMKHMNDDHPGSIRAYACAFGIFQDPEHQHEVKRAKITDVEVDCFILEVVLNDGQVLQGIQVPYTKRITDAKQLHGIAIDMHLKSFDKLGVGYKIRNGYYTQAVSMISDKLYRKYPKTSVGLMSVTMGAIVILGGLAIQSRVGSSAAAVSTNSSPQKESK